MALFSRLKLRCCFFGSRDIGNRAAVVTQLSERLLGSLEIYGSNPSILECVIIGLFYEKIRQTYRKRGNGKLQQLIQIVFANVSMVI